MRIGRRPARSRFESGWFKIECSIKSYHHLALPAPDWNLVGFLLNLQNAVRARVADICEELGSQHIVTVMVPTIGYLRCRVGSALGGPALRLPPLLRKGPELAPMAKAVAPPIRSSMPPIRVYVY